MKKVLFLKVSFLILVFSYLLISCKKKDDSSVPILTTTPVTQITANSAYSGGNITDDGNETVLYRGVCWSINTEPTILENKTIDGAGVGSFSSSITKLEGGHVYYLRAYATNSKGTGYGMTVSFKTLGDPPTVTTSTPSNITTTSAVLNAIVSGNYLTTVVTFEYGLTTSYGNSISAINKGEYNYVASLTGLAVGTIYHFRVKGVNSLGTSYGLDMNFKTLGDLPKANTKEASEIQTNSAILNAEVFSNDLSTTASFDYGLTKGYGNTISTIQNPVLGGSNMGFILNAKITNLLNDTIYHYRIQAINQAGTSFGEDMTFRTLGKKPSIIKSYTNQVTSNTAKLIGLINPNGYTTTVKYEIGTSSNYSTTILFNRELQGGMETIADSLLSNLNPNTEYHYRIIATNEIGSTTSIDQKFNTSIILSDIVGNEYNTVLLGEQLWMAENLKTTKFNNGDSIPFVQGESWKNLTSPAYCEININGLGALYNWFSIQNDKICPSGWHVPTDADWNDLVNYLVNNGYGFEGSGNDIGKSIANSNVWESSQNVGAIGHDQELNNSSGFSAIPAGLCGYNGIKYSSGTTAVWWTSTEKDTYIAFSKSIHSSSDNITTISEDKKSGFSIRCIKNK